MVKIPVKEIPHPPVTFEEFLEFEKVDDWPQALTSESVLDLSEVPRIWSKEEIIDDLQKSAPFELESLDKMEIVLDEFCDRLMYFSSYITSPEDRPSRIPDNLFHAPRKEILEKASEFDAVRLHHSRRKKKKDVKEVLAEAEQASRTRNIDYVNFPGFRPKELTELPSQLEAPQLLNKVTEAQSFNRGFLQLWKKLFYSEASIAVMQDTFWWFFLENFEHNTHAQDKLFTRIADSYIALFFSAHPDIRDKFFKEYPRCLAQVVYLTFCEAFPESSDRMTEQFVSELANLTSEWIAGVKPPVTEWRKWPWEKLGHKPEDLVGGTNVILNDRAGAPGSRGAPDFAKELAAELELQFPAQQVPTAPSDGTKFQEVLISVTGDDSARQKDSTGDQAATRKTRAKSLATSTKYAFDRAKNEESAQAGPGPDFERVLFNMGGRSPLVAQHLYMKHLRNKELVGRSMRRTEVLQQQVDGMTFNDVIMKSKKTIKGLHAQRERSDDAAQKEIAKVHAGKRRAIKKIEALQKSLTDPLEIKIRSDKVLDQALEKGSHRPTTYVSSKAPSNHSALLKEDAGDT
nr:protein FAM227B [Ciona intestinalis]|eukprot:XP_002131035.2 protein FAM227B [Ciona intestinalis]